MANLPDKGIRQTSQSDGRRQVFVHGRSIETRPESVKARQTFGHFEVVIPYNQVSNVVMYW